MPIWYPRNTINPSALKTVLPLLQESVNEKLVEKAQASCLKIQVVVLSSAGCCVKMCRLLLTRMLLGVASLFFDTLVALLSFSMK